MATPYVEIILEAVRKLHEAYPNQQIELRAIEDEQGGWQCRVDFTDHGAHLGSESFYINPSDQ